MATFADEQKHLSPDQRQLLERVPRKHERLFSGTLGEWPEIEVDVELKPSVQPFHCRRPMRIPHVYHETLKKEVMRLCDLDVLEMVRGGQV